MKKILSILVSVTLLFSMVNVGNPKVFAKTFAYKTVSDKKTFNNNGKRLLEMSYSSIKIEGSSKAIKKINKKLKSKTTIFMSNWNSNKEAVLKGEKELSGIADSSYTSMSLNIKVTGDTKKYFSVSQSYIEYWKGAAHPNSVTSGIVFSKKTGKELMLNKILKLSKKKTKKKIIKKLSKFNKKYQGVLYDDYSKLVKNYKLKDFNYYIEGNNLVVTFSPYEIACYAVGYINIKFKL